MKIPKSDNKYRYLQQKIPNHDKIKDLVDDSSKIGQLPPGDKINETTNKV